MCRGEGGGEEGEREGGEEGRWGEGVRWDGIYTITKAVTLHEELERGWSY